MAKGIAPKKGKKNRKHGKGDRKLSHSKWGSYAALIARQQKRRLESLVRRTCVCGIIFHSRNAFKRHDC